MLCELPGSCSDLTVVLSVSFTFFFLKSKFFTVSFYPLLHGPPRAGSKAGNRDAWTSNSELEGEEDIKKSEAQTYVFHAMKTNYKIRMHYHNCLYLCFKEFAVFWI